MHDPMDGPGSPYEPVNANPDIDRDAGYGNAVPPPPPDGAQEVQVSPYALQPVPLPGRMVGLLSGGQDACRGFLYGLAGVAIALALHKAKPSLWTAAKGALGGTLGCWLVSRKRPGLPATAVAIAGGYTASRYWK